MQKFSKPLIILVFVSVIISDFAFAQKKPLKIDSTKVYENIESFSVKRKFTKYMYRTLFKPVAASSQIQKAKKKVYKKLIHKPYSAFEGKIIRNIHIITLDPSGYSIADTVVRAQSALAKTTNRLHIKTQGITIRNLILIRKNQVFDSLLVKESERLLRNRGFVTDVSFYVTTTARKSDSVDIYIRELDKWSIIPSGSVSASSLTFSLREDNFMGLGHELNNEITWNHKTSDYGYKVHYYIPNVRNTYINSTLNLVNEVSGNYARNIAIDRPFFSPFAKWAAGIGFAQYFRKDYIHVNDSLLILQRFKFSVQDYWVGNAFQLFRGSTENRRTTNFVSAVRFYNVRYFEKPSEEYDFQHFFSNENLYMASIGIVTRKYVQDTYIFKFGVTEDVPVGKAFNLTGGYQAKNNKGRFYLGASISAGNYYPWGYFSFNCESGTFIDESLTEQGVITAGVNYFTGLVEVGKWKFRQFAKTQLIIGINRSVFDSLTLNDKYGLEGFNSSSLSGTSRMVFTIQTQSYAPWNFIGFRFGPFLTFSLGKLGDATTGFRNSKLFSEIGIGVLIKNDHLVINTFQISFAFFPVIPGIGQNIFKVNSFQTADFGFRDFEIGKPAVVLYQ